MSYLSIWLFSKVMFYNTTKYSIGSLSEEWSIYFYLCNAYVFSRKYFMSTVTTVHERCLLVAAYATLKKKYSYESAFWSTKCQCFRYWNVYDTKWGILLQLIRSMHLLQVLDHLLYDRFIEQLKEPGKRTLECIDSTRK